MSKSKGTPGESATETRPGPSPRSYAGNSSPLKDGQRRDSRRVMWQARRWLWANSSISRVQRCGRVPYGLDVGVVRTGEGRARFAGLETCGSVHACPACAGRINAARCDEVAAALGRWRAANREGSIVFATFTMRHHAGNKLADLWADLAGAWQYLTSGGAWQEMKAAHEIDGWVRVVEATHGRSGWHLHIHAAILVKKKEDAETLEQLGDALWERWEKGLKRRGRMALRGPGVDVRYAFGTSGLSRYFAKTAAELTRGDAKRLGKGRAPFAILRDLSQGHASPRDLARWHEWEAASRGRRVVGWSQGLRARLGVGEVSDEDLAKAEAEGTEAEEVLLNVPTWEWGKVARDDDGPASLLHAAETGGLNAAAAWLDARRISWTLPPLAGGLSPPEAASGAAAA